MIYVRFSQSWGLNGANLSTEKNLKFLVAVIIVVDLFHELVGLIWKAEVLRFFICYRVPRIIFVSRVLYCRRREVFYVWCRICMMKYCTGEKNDQLIIYPRRPAGGRFKLFIFQNWCCWGRFFASTVMPDLVTARETEVPETTTQPADSKWALIQREERERPYAGLQDDNTADKP